MIRSSRYFFPRGMRPATVADRRKFYRNEFSIRRIHDWFRRWTHPIVFALVIGRHTRIYPKKDGDKYRDTIIIDEYSRVEDVLDWLLLYPPESVYYDRNIYRSWEQAQNGLSVYGLGRSYGQELAFDVDPENFTCPIHGTLEEKMKRRQGLSFCRLELQMAKTQSVELYEVLSQIFSDVRLVYSGRGFHLHVLDDSVLWWGRTRRLRFARSLVRTGFVMDEWVTAGGMRMIRLPYSLNGLVSRICLPLRLREMDLFDPLTDPRAKPRFLARK